MNRLANPVPGLIGAFLRDEYERLAADLAAEPVRTPNMERMMLSARQKAEELRGVYPVVEKVDNAGAAL